MSSEMPEAERQQTVIRHWSLRRRLVVSATGLVLLTLLLAAAVTVFSLRASLYERIDEDVRVGLQLASGPEDSTGPDDASAPNGASEPDGTAGPGDSASPDGTGPGAIVDRQRDDSIKIVLDADGTTTTATYVSPEGTSTTLTSAQVATVLDAVSGHQDPVTVSLGDSLGDFRVLAGDSGGSDSDGSESNGSDSGGSNSDGSTTVTGLSLRDTNVTISSLTGILAVVLGAGLLICAVGITWLVTAMLRPLRRVADTAERVAKRPLAAGAVSLPERVDLNEDPETEVGRVGAALDTMLSHVEASLAARQESEERLRTFIADASHELRTPLASIRGYAQLAQDEETDKSATLVKSLGRIEAESERMGVLVEDLLLLARLDAGQTLRKEPVDIALLAIETTDDIHAAHTDHEWRVEVDESIEVLGDEPRLRQVLINLLGNAAAHTPPGTTVTTSVVRESDQEDGQECDRVRVTVADDGPGIDAELLPRIFDRFARADIARNRASGSTGLGLSIAAAIVRSHGGEIHVSNSDQGAVFTVVLPTQPTASTGD